jgi:hypothetical protein
MAVQSSRALRGSFSWKLGGFISKNEGFISNNGVFDRKMIFISFISKTRVFLI